MNSLLEYWKSAERRMLEAGLPEEHILGMRGIFYAGAFACLNLTSAAAHQQKEGKISFEEAAAVVQSMRREVEDHHQQLRQRMRES